MRRLLVLIAVLALVPASAFGFTPHHGHYKGTDGSHRPVTFDFTGGYVRGWLLDERIAMPDVYVSTANHAFGLLSHGRHLRGHWTDADHVTGTLSYQRPTRQGTVTVTIHWSARRT